MASDRDKSISLPTPPPPRPAARREAMEAALRKFDGAEEAPRRKQRKASWWASHRRQFGAFATAALIAVVSVPVALTVLRDQPKPVPPRVGAPPAVQSSPSPISVEPAEPQPSQADEIVADVPRSRLPLEPHEESRPLSLVEEKKAADEAPAVAPAAPPPPPPPPSPAPAPARTEQYAYDASPQEMVVTGSRAPSGNLGKQSDVRQRSLGSASPATVVDAYTHFLSRLQTAVRANNKKAVVGLVGLPLRVNFGTGSEIYRDRRSIERDFDRIFTSRVRQAILDERDDQLFRRDQGAMIGDGEVWFDQTCPNASCSPVGPMRIRAINP